MNNAMEGTTLLHDPFHQCGNRISVRKIKRLNEMLRTNELCSRFLQTSGISSYENGSGSKFGRDDCYVAADSGGCASNQYASAGETQRIRHPWLAARLVARSSKSPTVWQRPISLAGSCF